MLRRLALVLGILSIGFVHGAIAADIPMRVQAPPFKTVPFNAYNWTGFYAGINGGAGWARSNHTDANGITTGNFNLSGGLVGGTVGYNWQNSNFVFGIEADWDWANISGSTTTLCGVGCNTKITSFGTARPRLGVTWDNFMVYVTGGLAWATVNAGQPGFTTNKMRAGWTVGAGAEAFLAPKWSVKLEYLYAGLNDSSYTVAVPVTVQERNISLVRAGVNYHF